MHCGRRPWRPCTCQRSLFVLPAQRFTTRPIVRHLSLARVALPVLRSHRVFRSPGSSPRTPGFGPAQPRRWFYLVHPRPSMAGPFPEGGK